MFNEPWEEMTRRFQTISEVGFKGKFVARAHIFYGLDGSLWEAIALALSDGTSLWNSLQNPPPPTYGESCRPSAWACEQASRNHLQRACKARTCIDPVSQRQHSCGTKAVASLVLSTMLLTEGVREETMCHGPSAR